MKRPSDPRSLALQALEALERRDAFADAVLDGLFRRHPGITQRDRALVSHLVYGVLRWRNRLDAHVALASARAPARMHPRLLQILRLGAYQVLFLDRIPDRAAVSESVELARSAGQGHAAGFVNAVLRKVATRETSLDFPSDPVGRLALELGCPPWLVGRWAEELGLDGAEVLCRGASRVPALWLRVDPARCSREAILSRLQDAGLPAQPGAFAPEAVWLPPSGDPRALPAVAEGLAVVQDQASQLVAHLVAPGPGWRILDACAAPGLKTTQLASLAQPGARVTALDVHAHRARQIEDLSRRLQSAGVTVVVADARTYRAEEPYDAVLVDAPCSGLGVLSRNPEAKWRRTPESLPELPPLQLSLLENLSDAVRPGGVLVYATCTTLRAENEEVVNAFLTRRRDFRPERPPEGQVPWERLLSPEGHLRTYPELQAGEGAEALDGFFAARLRRSDRP
ncbi:MAG: 16S rRNA (cytosine(967)-C(5))-methyltransferase RsmB [Deferrisomatales bacterium]